MKFKVWYIDLKGQDIITKKTFKSFAEANEYARELEAKGLVHADCMEAEGARAFQVR